MANKIYAKSTAKGFNVNPISVACGHCTLKMYFVPQPGSGNPVVCPHCGKENK